MSAPDGSPPPDRPGKARCPTQEELDRVREAREERSREATHEAEAAVGAAAGGGREAARPELVREARERQRQQAQEREAELRGELRAGQPGGEPGGAGAGAGMGAGMGGGGAGGAGATEAEGSRAEAAQAEEQAARLAELKRRVAMAQEEEGGARPYEVLELEEQATQAEVRRVPSPRRRPWPWLTLAHALICAGAPRVSPPLAAAPPR